MRLMLLPLMRRPTRWYHETDFVSVQTDFASIETGFASDETDLASVKEKAYSLVLPMPHNSANWSPINATRLQATFSCPTLAPAPSLSPSLRLSL